MANTLLLLFCLFINKPTNKQNNKKKWDRVEEDLSIKYWIFTEVVIGLEEVAWIDALAEARIAIVVNNVPDAVELLRFFPVELRFVIVGIKDVGVMG